MDVLKFGFLELGFQVGVFQLGLTYSILGKSAVFFSWVLSFFNKKIIWVLLSWIMLFFVGGVGDYCVPKFFEGLS